MPSRKAPETVGSTSVEKTIGPLAVARAGVVDAGRGFARLVCAVNERQSLRPVAQVFELRQHAVAERFGRDAGAVRYEEDGAIVRRRARACDIGGC